MRAGRSRGPRTGKVHLSDESTAVEFLGGLVLFVALCGVLFLAGIGPFVVARRLSQLAERWLIRRK